MMSLGNSRRSANLLIRLGSVGSPLVIILRLLITRIGNMAKIADVLVRNEGSLFLFHPLSDAAKDWIKEHIPDDAQWFGKALVVETRYVGNIVEGMRADGLTFGDFAS